MEEIVEECRRPQRLGRVQIEPEILRRWFQQGGERAAVDPVEEPHVVEARCGRGRGACRTFRPKITSEGPRSCYGPAMIQGRITGRKFVSSVRMSLHSAPSAFAAHDVEGNACLLEP